MVAAIYERVESRKLTVSLESPSAEFAYVVYRTLDENEARALIEATIGPYYLSADGGVLPYQSYDIEHQGNGIWFVTARYSARQQRGAGAQPDLSGTGGGTGEPPGGGSPLQPAAGTSGGRTAAFNFELGTQTVKLTQSLSTVNTYSTGVDGAPDCKGAIGVNGDAVDGVDIDKPVLTFSETHYFEAAFIDEAYVSGLVDLAEKPVNDSGFRGFEAGEVRFLGAVGSLKDEQGWEVTFRFAVSRNRSDLVVGDMTGIVKKGWHYVWIRYQDSLDSNQLVKQPTSVYVERVYESSSFDVLGIGA